MIHLANENENAYAAVESMIQDFFGFPQVPTNSMGEALTFGLGLNAVFAQYLVDQLVANAPLGA